MSTTYRGMYCAAHRLMYSSGLPIGTVLPIVGPGGLTATVGGNDTTDLQGHVTAGQCLMFPAFFIV